MWYSRDVRIGPCRRLQVPDGVTESTPLGEHYSVSILRQAHSRRVQGGPRGKRQGGGCVPRKGKPQRQDRPGPRIGGVDLQLASQFRVHGLRVRLEQVGGTFPDWTAYNEMTGIGGWRKRDEHAGPYWYWKDGKVVSDTSAGSAGQHGARLPFEVTTRDAEHPIMKGLPAEWLHVNDELYGALRGPGKNMTVLATATVTRRTRARIVTSRC